MAEPAEQLENLSRAYGIAPEYHDIWGRPRRTSPEAQKALLRAMGLRVETDAELGAELEACEVRAWTRRLGPILVVRPPHDAIEVPFNVEDGLLDSSLVARLHLENGGIHEQLVVPREGLAGGTREIASRTWVRCKLTLGVNPGLGYHHFTLTERGQAPRVSPSMPLVVAPSRCYEPASLAGGQRVWGPALQLYALRSAHNWGIGDFRDLEQLAVSVAKLGAGIVGLNPLHALFPCDPVQASPYSPSSRLFQNPLYLDVEAIPEFTTSPVVSLLVGDPAFRARLNQVRACELVDYVTVAELKRGVLELCYAQFRREQLEPLTDRGREFRAFVDAGGEALAAYGRFEALTETHHGKRWFEWPGPLRAPAVERVEFHQWVQWQVEQQLGRVSATAQELGLELGLYRDLAVSVDRSGFDSWRRQDVYAVGASYGAPPDDFAARGQDWGLPPWIPERLREARYEPFIEVLRTNMRHAGALRIDHVMGLMRAYWVPPGASPEEGAYVHYPFDDLLGILALESQRARCLIVGEDLGTVPDEVRTRLATEGVLSYRVLYFMKNDAGELIPPSDYPEQALVTITTHDLPTLAGFWSGRDIELRHELGQSAKGQAPEEEIARRAQARRQLLRALEREGLLPAGMNPDAPPAVMTPALALAIHRFVARTPSRIVSFQLEDALGALEQANLPGTTGEHPNWCRKLEVDLESLGQDVRFSAMTAALREERG